MIRKRQSGFSLMEVLLSLSILLFSLVFALHLVGLPGFHHVGGHDPGRVGVANLWALRK